MRPLAHPKKVVIFGTGEFAQIAHLYLTKDSPYEVAAFTVHQKYLTQQILFNLKVVPFEQIMNQFPPDRYAMFVAIGFKNVNRNRTEIYHACKKLGYTLIRYVHSKALCWEGIEIGDNCFIFENNVIQPFVKIGNNVIVWSGNHIGHHAAIGDNCFISSHAVISGNVRIGRNCFIGVNATVKDGVTIAPECVIGAGALLLKDTAEKEVYKTTSTDPARYKSDQWRGLL